MQKNNRQHRYKPPSNQAQTAGLMSKQQAAQNTKKASDELLKTDSERASDAYNRQVADIQNNPSLTDAQKNKYIAKLTDNKVKYDWTGSAPVADVGSSKGLGLGAPSGDEEVSTDVPQEGEEVTTYPTDGGKTPHANGEYNPNTGIYTVETNDTRYSIAKRFGLTVAQLPEPLPVGGHLKLSKTGNATLAAIGDLGTDNTQVNNMTGFFYRSNGEFIERTGNSSWVWLRTDSIDGGVQLLRVAFINDFLFLGACMYAETFSNATMTEVKAIGHAVKNNLLAHNADPRGTAQESITDTVRRISNPANPNRSGYTRFSQYLEVTPEEHNANNTMKQCAKAAIEIILRGPNDDTTNGATFWDGINDLYNMMAEYDDPNLTQRDFNKMKHGFRINAGHETTSALSSRVCTVTSKVNAGVVYSYESTAVIGSSIFSKCDDDFLALGNRAW